ncbi:amidohydrolase family protein [Arthrobacter rhombi]
MVLDHLGKPRRSDEETMPRWRREVRALAELPQTVAKVSGLFVPGLPYTADALRQAWDEAFGPERLMFGGDWPISRLGGSYVQTAGPLFELISTLSVDEQESVLRGTAARVYRLDGKCQSFARPGAGYMASRNQASTPLMRTVNNARVDSASPSSGASAMA